MFQAPATIMKIQTLADQSLKLDVITQELSPESNAELFNYKGKLGWVLFKEKEIKPEDLKDIPELEPEFKQEKTPSQRLRNVIYRFWEQQTDKLISFNEYYKMQMEYLIEQYKSKLEN